MSQQTNKIQLPGAFVERIKVQFDDSEHLLQAIDSEPIVSVRKNSAKNTQSLFANCEPVPWCNTGYYLNERPKFVFEPKFHAGAYYVQEASSMFLQHIVNNAGVNTSGLWLDLCAAPGGKSTLLASALGTEGVLIANEMVPKRASILKENVLKWGVSQVMVSNNAPEAFTSLADTFDFILVDAPCSGEGMFRKDPVAITEWSEENVAACSVRQKNIIDAVWPALKPGGIMVYSTCTYNTAENEEILEYLATEFDACGIPVSVDPTWNIEVCNVKNVTGFRFKQHKVLGEGLFMAVLQKPGENAFCEDKSIAPRNALKGGEWENFFTNPQSYWFFEHKGKINNINKHCFSVYEALKSPLNIILSFREAAILKGQVVIPSEFLPFAVDFNREAFPCIEIDEPTAIKIQQKGTPVIEGPTGWVCLLFDGIPVAMVKNIGSRINNHFPAEWRIRLQE